MKNKMSIACGAVSAALVIAFAVKVIADRSRYTETFCSAPFSVWVLTDALFLLLPAAIIFAAGRIAGKRR